jgi:uncharacterized membrane protein
MYAVGFLRALRVVSSHQVETSQKIGAFMKHPGRWLFIGIVAFLAYVLGAKAGRSRYREIKATAEAFWNDPTVKKARIRARKSARKTTKAAAKKAQKRLGKAL